jgi:hypothetical protein
VRAQQDTRLRSARGGLGGQSEQSERRPPCEIC